MSSELSSHDSILTESGILRRFGESLASVTRLQGVFRAKAAFLRTRSLKAEQEVNPPFPGRYPDLGGRGRAGGVEEDGVQEQQSLLDRP